MFRSTKTHDIKGIETGKALLSHKEVIRMENEELELNFETGEIKRGETLNHDP